MTTIISEKKWQDLQEKHEAEMAMLSHYEALHGFHEQLHSLKCIKKISDLYVSYINGVLHKHTTKIHAAVFLTNIQKMEFNYESSYPNEIKSNIFEDEFHALTKQGMIGWSVKNRKISFHEHHATSLGSHSVLVPLFTQNHVYGIVLIILDFDPAKLTYEEMQFMKLSANYVGMCIENNQALHQVTWYRLELEKLVEKRTRQLRLSQKRYHTVLNNVPIGIILIDKNGMIVSANKCAHEVLFADLQALNNYPIKHLFQKEDWQILKRDYSWRPGAGMTVTHRLYALNHKQVKMKITITVLDRSDDQAHSIWMLEPYK